LLPKAYKDAMNYDLTWFLIREKEKTQEQNKESTPIQTYNCDIQVIFVFKNDWKW
jgi:hypothetical protein